MIKHIHLPECNSTQHYLKDMLTPQNELQGDQQNTLISTSYQSQGIGRKNNTWLHYKNSLAFSFTLAPHETLSLTPLEVGVLISEFLNQQLNTHIQVKWPNDLFIEQKKVGGILINSGPGKKLIVGVGLNFGDLDGPSEFPNYQATSVSTDHPIDKKEFPLKIYNHILKHRITDRERVKDRWLKLCAHLNKKVSITDNGKEDVCGTFNGIGNYGEAIIEIDDQQFSLFSGSLIYS